MTNNDLNSNGIISPRNLSYSSVVVEFWMARGLLYLKDFSSKLRAGGLSHLKFFM